MKIKKINLIIFVFSLVSCFFITRWYYRSHYEQEAIKQTMANIDFFHLLSSKLSKDRKSTLILNAFYDLQIKFLAKNLNIRYDESIDPIHIIQKVDKDRYKTVQFGPSGPSGPLSLPLPQTKSSNMKNDKKSIKDGK